MELDDEFSLDSKEQAQGSKVAQSKSMKTVYEQLAKKAIKQESGTKQIKKQKRVKVEKQSKAAKRDNNKSKKIVEKVAKGDLSCRYIKNRALQSQLKQKALSGVLKIMNMISKTQAERKVE